MRLRYDNILRELIQDADDDSKFKNLTFNQRHGKGNSSPARNLTFIGALKDHDYEDIPDWIKEGYPDGYYWALDNGLSDFQFDEDKLIPHLSQKNKTANEEGNSEGEQAFELSVSTANGGHNKVSPEQQKPRKKKVIPEHYACRDELMALCNENEQGHQYCYIDQSSETHVFTPKLTGRNYLNQCVGEPDMPNFQKDAPLDTRRATERLRRQEIQRREGVIALGYRLWKYHQLTVTSIKYLSSGTDRELYLAQELFAEKMGNLSYRVALSKHHVHLMSWQAIKNLFHLEHRSEALFVQQVSIYEDTYVTCQRINPSDKFLHVVTVHESTVHGDNSKLVWKAFCDPQTVV